MKEENTSADIRCLTLDLSSLTAVRKAAAQVNAYPEPIHVLINNAVVAIDPYKVTVDGRESQIATDHVGAFLLTNLISRRLLAAKTAAYTPRVVVLTSFFHSNAQGLDFAQMQRPDAGKYDAFGAYNEAKSANVFFAAELSQRAAGKINAYSVSPDAIFTNIQQKPDSFDAFHGLGQFLTSFSSTGAHPSVQESSKQTASRT
ncbi:hypothetical protein B0H10DRAFT_2094849 [Mycena sp. CBHHK59/15]|nr:hypothetical protein B0H10DRAFT_2094849 [Mycena sp. CBHHK59/15]